MAEKPWTGAGWNEPERTYEYYYLPPHLTEAQAIQMNDYLMLGATLGIPALVCFGMYVWLALTGKAESGKLKAEKPYPETVSTIHHPLSSSDWLQITCRAGAIVLLVGFWFDGGLFKLPTASIFWVLLELGRIEEKDESGSEIVHEGRDGYDRPLYATNQS
jgi:O-antigen ligase